MDQMTMTYEEFRNTFLETLNAYAPIKKKTVRGNNAPFMNKTLSKAFMQRTKLKNRYNKSPSVNNYSLYKKQRNFCSNLLKREKKKYYNNLNLNILKDNKQFWKTIRPFFSDKQKDYQADFTLIDNDEVTSNDNEVAEKFNNFFTDVIENLGIDPYIKETEIDPCPDTPINNIVRKYENHPSILKIKEYVTISDKFSFAKTPLEEFQKGNFKNKPQKSNSRKRHTH